MGDPGPPGPQGPPGSPKYSHTIETPNSSEFSTRTTQPLDFNILNQPIHDKINALTEEINQLRVQNDRRNSLSSKISQESRYVKELFSYQLNEGPPQGKLISLEPGNHKLTFGDLLSSTLNSAYDQELGIYKVPQDGDYDFWVSVPFSVRHKSSLHSSGLVKLELQISSTSGTEVLNFDSRTLLFLSKKELYYQEVLKIKFSGLFGKNDLVTVNLINNLPVPVELDFRSVFIGSKIRSANLEE